MDGQSALIQGAEAVSLFCRLNINTKKDLPIRSSEMGLLILVARSEVSVTPIMAAEFFKVKKPMITTMVQTLVSKGYLFKTPSPTDNRSYLLCATEKASTLVEQAYAEYLKTMGLLQSRLGNAKYAALIDLLSKANAILLEGKQNG